MYKTCCCCGQHVFNEKNLFFWWQINLWWRLFHHLHRIPNYRWLDEMKISENLGIMYGQNFQNLICSDCSRSSLKKFRWTIRMQTIQIGSPANQISKKRLPEQIEANGYLNMATLLTSCMSGMLHKGIGSTAQLWNCQ